MSSFGLGFLVMLDAGPVVAGDRPDGTERGVRNVVAVRPPDPETRLKILEIVRNAGSKDRRVRVEAIRDWYRHRFDNAFLPLITGLTFSSPQSRSFSAWALGETRNPRAIGALGRRALFDENDVVRRTAVDSIRKIAASQKEPTAIQPFVKSLESPEFATRIRAAKALGDIGDGRAVRYLVRTLTTTGGPSPRVNIFSGRQVTYIRDYDAEVAQSAAIAEPKVGIVTEGTVLDTRIIRTQARTRVYRQVVVRSLEKLSGQRFGDDVKAWRRWYREKASAAEAPFGRPAAGRAKKAEN
jgi:hypothetical protein